MTAFPLTALAESNDNVANNVTVVEETNLNGNINYIDQDIVNIIESIEDKEVKEKLLWLHAYPAFTETKRVRNSDLENSIILNAIG